MYRLKAALMAVALATLGLMLPSAALAQVGVADASNAPFRSGRATARVALIPVVVHSSEDPGYLREGLRDMLVSRLEQGGRLEVVLVDASRATTNLADALETGDSAGVDFVLFGSFTRFGQGASLDMQCAATESKDGGPPLRQIFVHSGDIAAMIPDLDELVGKVARFIGEYGGTAVAAPGPGGGTGPIRGHDGALSGLGPANVSTGELLERIKALEEAVRALRAEP